MYVYVYIANVCVYEMGYEDAENKQAVLICSRTLFLLRTTPIWHKRLISNDENI